MKQILIILGLFASVSTFAQSPRIKLNQITKDTVKGSVLISSPSDSGMVYSRDFYIAYGADTVLILYGDTLGGVGGGFASVLSDGVTVTGNGTSGNELKVDTLLIATIKALNDSLATISASTTPDGVTITGDGSVGNPLKVDTATVISTIQGLVDTLTNRGYLTANQTITLSGDVTGSGTTAITATVVDDSHNHIISNVDFLQDSLNAKANDSDLANYVTLNGTDTITGAKTFTSDLNVDAKIALNAGDNNIVIGDGAGASLVSGQALNNVLVGTSAGAAIDSGGYNIAIGYQALYSNTTGNSNIVNGYQALYSNTSGYQNVANGSQALYKNETGIRNIANGHQALFNNISGGINIANGYRALYTNTTGGSNVANGYQALRSNTSGSSNVANGRDALFSNTTGSNNVANGFASLYSLSSGSNNQAYGYEAGRYLSDGSTALTTANGSLFLGSNTKASANLNSNEIVIGTDAIGNGSNTITIGSSSAVSLHTRNYEFDIDQTVGGATDNYVLTYDNGDGQISLEPATGGGLSSVSVDSVTIYGDGLTTPLYADTAKLATTTALNDSITNSLSGYVTIAGTETITGAKTLTNTFTQSGGNVTINEGNGNYDFRVEGDNANSTHMLFADASENEVRLNSTNTYTSNNYNWDNGNYLLQVNGGDNSFYTQSGTVGVDFNVGRKFSTGTAYGYGKFTADAINEKFIFANNTDTTLYVDATTNSVGIGTTSPSENLDVNGNGRFRSIGSGASAGALHYTSTGVLTTNTSDARLKTNLQPLENTLNKLLNINTYTFNWINETNRVDLGMVAQEVEQIFPNLVFTNSVDGYKGIHYDKFSSILTKAIQEQQAIIETQEQKITDLETTIQALIIRIENLENK